VQGLKNAIVRLEQIEAQSVKNLQAARNAEKKARKALSNVHIAKEAFSKNPDADAVAKAVYPDAPREQEFLASELRQYIATA
jgi:hypothetical protein